MNTTVWLIRYTANGKRCAVVHTHNAIADYRRFDAQATTTPIDCAHVERLFESVRIADRSSRTVVDTDQHELIAVRPDDWRALRGAVAACGGAW